MTSLRIAIIGVGYLGRFHVQKLAHMARSQLVGVFDTDSERAAAVAAEFGTRAYKSIEDLVSDVDAVSIAASTPQHYQLAKYCLQHGLHVCIEKPIAETSTQARELLTLANTANRKLQVGHIERFNPALIAAQTYLKEPRFIECHRLAAFKARGADVDVVLDLMIHDLDIVLALVDSEPESVSAMGLSVLTERIDIANARIRFVNGAIANVTASRVSTSAQRKFRVFQSNQYIAIDFGANRVQRVSSDNTENNPEENLDTESWQLDKQDALQAELSAFVDAVLDDRSVLVSGEDGCRALELAEAVLASIEAGGS